ncbi:MAG TPA: hypothetical protein VE575_06185 [Acidimicrobiales bacterium]|nr:hypothetical protein [Acidimicrobiales bacterium]
MSGTVRRLLVGLAVIMLLAAGCGDDGGSADEGGSADGDENSEAGEARNDADSAVVQEFCTGFGEWVEQYADVDPLEDPEALDEAIAELRQLDPPDELAEDYGVVIDGFQALADIDMTDEEALAEVQEEFAGAEGAFSAVQGFLDEEC